MFLLGKVVATPGAQSLPIDFQLLCLKRHINCDWGDGFEPEDTEKDKKANDVMAAFEDGRILSIYKVDENLKMWIVTEGSEDDRITTLLLPSEY